MSALGQAMVTNFEKIHGLIIQTGVNVSKLYLRILFNIPIKFRFANCKKITYYSYEK